MPASRHRYCYPFDDTVAIKSEKAEGLDGFPLLLRRCRLPKGAASVPGNDFFVGALAQPPPLAKPEPRGPGHSQRQASTALSSTANGDGGIDRGGDIGGHGGGGGADIDHGEASGGIGGPMVTWQDLR